MRIKNNISIQNDQNGAFAFFPIQTSTNGSFEFEQNVSNVSASAPTA